MAAKAGTATRTATATPSSRWIPAAEHYGRSYAEWGAMWWQWVYGLPATHHPLLDETGADCAVGQSGEVWFLGGTFGGAAERRCTVPAGQAVFFPLVNVSVDNAAVPKEVWMTDEELIAGAEDFVNDVTALVVELDGVAIPDLGSYRAGPHRFSYTLPNEDNLYQLDGTEFAGIVDPSFSDGFWMMFGPLRAGEHTLHFGGTVSSQPEDFVIDVTYHLTVE